MKKTSKIVAIALAGVFLLAGCSNQSMPKIDSGAEDDYIVACSKAGGTYIAGNETPGRSYRGMCTFRYPALPNQD